MVGEKKRPYSTCYRQGCLLEDPNSEVVFCLFGPSKHFCSFLTASKGLDWVLFRSLAATLHRSITAEYSARIFFLLCFSTQNSCREDLSQTSVNQIFFQLKWLFFFFFLAKQSCQKEDCPCHSHTSVFPCS